MAIIKRAKNLTINTKGTYTSICKHVEIVSKEVQIVALEGNLELNSGKKIIVKQNNN
ncbi:hypothetical protein [Capnocytophaga leadbetteri]|uniref:hypothetical protein n=1 Tax=Capnocytophaga leadbetteri TaxID=327575 RepID=UPI0026ED4392|nr:hypothetical protein [Capnocytophaga leadbetteri]